ncbi:MAG: preprotein translocase subunit SecG [Treponema sp.]|jgi:preprotein translocase subunit SecG|nr:preprotein translocase subunit SecG [Treponema sp.]
MALKVVLLVFFVIVAILLILLVLIQNEEGDSLGGIFAGGSGSAFGSRSGNILTKTTTVLGALFLIISLGLALLNRTGGGTGVDGVEAEGLKLAPERSADWWRERDGALDDGAPAEALPVPAPFMVPESGIELETAPAGEEALAE